MYYDFKKSCRTHVKTSSKKLAKKQKMDLRLAAENDCDQSKKDSHKMSLQQQRDDGTGTMAKRNKDQRVQPISSLHASILLYSCFMCLCI